MLLPTTNKRLFTDIIKKISLFFDFLNNNLIEDVTIFGPSLGNNNYKLEEFIHGMQLKSYSFDIYKSSKQKNKLLICFN